MNGMPIQMFTMITAISASEVLVSQPGWSVATPMQRAQEPVERAVVLVEDPAPDRAGDDQRDQPRQQEQRAQHAAEREAAPEEHGDREPDGELPGDRADGEQDRVRAWPC